MFSLRTMLFQVALFITLVSGFNLQAELTKDTGPGFFENFRAKQSYGDLQRLLKDYRNKAWAGSWAKEAAVKWDPCAFQLRLERALKHMSQIKDEKRLKERQMKILSQLLGFMVLHLQDAYICSTLYLGKQGAAEQNFKLLMNNYHEVFKQRKVKLLVSYKDVAQSFVKKWETIKEASGWSPEWITFIQKSEKNEGKIKGNPEPRKWFLKFGNIPQDNMDWYFLEKSSINYLRYMTKMPLLSVFLYCIDSWEVLFKLQYSDVVDNDIFACQKECIDQQLDLFFENQQQRSTIKKQLDTINNKNSQLDELSERMNNLSLDNNKMEERYSIFLAQQKSDYNQKLSEVIRASSFQEKITSCEYKKKHKQLDLMGKRCEEGLAVLQREWKRLNDEKLLLRNKVARIVKINKKCKKDDDQRKRLNHKVLLEWKALNKQKLLLKERERKLKKKENVLKKMTARINKGSETSKKT